MSEKTIVPYLAKMTYGEHTLCGASKMVFSEHKGKTLYGGVAIPNISLETDEKWHMAVGSLIFVPIKTFVAIKNIEGWSLEDLVCQDGLEQYNWKEINL